MYVMVVVADGKIDTAKSFDDLIDARLAADEVAEDIDPELDGGDVAVFELDQKTGNMKMVYNPELGVDAEEDEDEEDEDEDDDFEDE